MNKTPKRRTPKKFKRTPLKSYKKVFTTLIIISFIIFLGLVIGIFYGTQIEELKDDFETVTTINIESIKSAKKENITFEEKTRALEIAYAKNSDNNIYIETKKEKQKNRDTFHFEEPNLEEIDKHEEHNNEKIGVEKPVLVDTKVEKVQIPITKKNISTKPKLAIIIDDMTTQRQIDNIQTIGYKVNMAFLPPTKGHTRSAKITKNLDQFLIHLPLQASSVRYEEENTLHIDDPIQKIEKRIRYLRQLYPNTNYLNNHTGSTFTSNTAAMDKLFKILKKYNYTFIDSRTTAKTVAKKTAKKYGVKMFSRNIFLDNKKDKKYIQKQLKKAIRIAKKNGMAIAIGHPYNITFRTLKDSKYLLKDLELVFVTEL